MSDFEKTSSAPANQEAEPTTVLAEQVIARWIRNISRVSVMAARESFIVPGSTFNGEPRLASETDPDTYAEIKEDIETMIADAVRSGYALGLDDGNANVAPTEARLVAEDTAEYPVGTEVLDGLRVSWPSMGTEATETETQKFKAALTSFDE